MFFFFGVDAAARAEEIKRLLVLVEEESIRAETESEVSCINYLCLLL